MHRHDLLAFLRSHRYAVQASVSPDVHPQAAVVGIAVLDNFELIFDTLTSTRKAINLRQNPNVAFVIGGWNISDPRTVQYQGIADIPDGSERDVVREQYFRVFPDGRDRLTWEGLIHVRVRPTWLRVSDYTRDPPGILELDASALRVLR